MPSYCAFLGHQPAISIAELSAAIPDFHIRHRFGNAVIVFESAEELSAEDLERWGGTMILGKSIGDAPIELDELPNALHAAVGKIRGKITFAIRGFGLPPRALRDLYRKGKDRLRAAGRPSRYIGNERVPAAAALLRDAGLLNGKHGVELIVLAEEDTLWTGVTLAAHDPDAYTERDIGKPVRDTTVGLLPPKLAQVLLNLGAWLVMQSAQEKKTASKKSPKSEVRSPKSVVVFDPFCGTGVIPMEALLRKWSVLASDVSLKAVNGCTKNIDWLRKKLELGKKDVPVTIWKQDATKPFADLPLSPHVIVTEGSLGPAMSQRPTLKDAQQCKRDAQTLTKEFLANAAASLPGVPIVMTWPVWYLRTGPLFLEGVMEAATELGYTPTLPPEVPSSSTDRTSLLYRRGEQFVGREIVLLQAKRSHE